MSDLDVWPARKTAEELRAGISQLAAGLESARADISTVVHGLHGDQHRVARELLVSVVGALDELDPSGLLRLIPVAEPQGVELPRREVGENTAAWFRGAAPMLRNRGPQ